MTYIYGLSESAAAIQKLPGKAVTRSSNSKSTCPAIEYYLERVKIDATQDDRENHVNTTIGIDG